MVLEVRKVIARGSELFHNVTKSGFLIPSKSFLIPEAADSADSAIQWFYKKYGVILYFSDMFRSSEEQLQLKKKYGDRAASPGFSGHNWGMSIDIHTNRIFAQFRKNKIPYTLTQLRKDMKKFKWSFITTERWHFNFLRGRKFIWEAIEQDFGQYWKNELKVSAFQQMLNELSVYTGKIDGIRGSMTNTAIKKFQEDYGLKADGIMGPVTRRVLVASTMKVKFR